MDKPNSRRDDSRQSRNKEDGDDSAPSSETETEEAMSDRRKSTANKSGADVDEVELGTQREKTHTKSKSKSSSSSSSPSSESRHSTANEKDKDEHTSRREGSRQSDEDQRESESKKSNRTRSEHASSERENNSKKSSRKNSDDKERESESKKDSRKHSDDEQREHESKKSDRKHSREEHIDRESESKKSSRKHSDDDDHREIESKKSTRKHSDVSDIPVEVSPKEDVELIGRAQSPEKTSKHSSHEDSKPRSGDDDKDMSQKNLERPAPAKRDPSAALDPFHEPFTHPVRPPARQVLGEGGSQPNTRESQRAGGEFLTTPPEFATLSRQRPRRRDHEVEEEIILDNESKFLPPPNNDEWNDEQEPEDHNHDENKKKAQKARRDSVGKRPKNDSLSMQINYDNSRVKPRAIEQPSYHQQQPPERQLQPAPPTYQPRPPRNTEPPLFTPRQGFDEKLPPLNAQRQGLITKKYANYYFTNDRVQPNLPQISQNKLSDSIEAIHNIQQNERNKGLYLQTIRNAIKKLRYLRHYDSLEAHQAIYMLVFSATRQLANEIGTIMVEEKSAEILVNMLKKLTSSNVFMTDLTWAVTSGILVIMSDYSHKNNIFARELADAGAIPVLLFNLQHKPVMNLMGSNKSVNDLITLCIATLYSISCVPETDHHFDKIKVPKILRTLYSSPSNVMRLLGTMTMANVLFDHDPMRLLEETGSIRYLVEALQEFARNIHSQKKRRAQDDGMATSRSHAESHSQSPNREGNSSSEGNIFTDGQPAQQGINFDALELLRTLSRLSIHDSHKNELVKLGVLNLYSSFLTSHNYAEQAMAAHALWSLVAGSNMGAAAAALNELTSMDDTITLLRKLAERSSDSAVRHNCQALMWLIENRDYNGSKSAGTQHFQTGGNPPGGQVFISYASTSDETVTRIVKKLRACGFMVQPDPAAGPESLPLPASIAAIESSNVILICCSERYKIEPRCRTEAEIVNLSRRPAIYLRMDFHLNFTGWLNNIVGHRDTLDVSGRRYSFEEGLKRLMRLMGLGNQTINSGSEKVGLIRRRPHKRDAPQRPPQQNSAAQKAPRRSQRVLAMNRDDVQHWLNDVGLNQFGDRFTRYDGQMVDNLFVLHHSAPEFVCQSLSAKLDGDLDNVIVFFTALNKLYDQ